MPTCTAPGCLIGKIGSLKEGSRLFSFPENKTLRNRWIRQLRYDPQKWKPGKNSYVCSKHFELKCFKSKEDNVDKKGRPLKRLNLVDGAIPTIFKHNRPKTKHSQL